MREIKFRAWMRQSKKMILLSATAFGDLVDNWFKNDYKIMQFTGLKDKNGKEIYEGDVVELHNWGVMTHDEVIGKAEIVWDTQTMKFDFRILDGDYIEDEYDRFRTNPKVIGNIYENPELINNTPKEKIK